MGRRERRREARTSGLPPLPGYAGLYFGLSDSRNEYASNPDQFVQSYVDVGSAVEKVVAGQRTLVFGPKGTGKSALAYFVEATAREHDLMVLVRDAATLPLAEIPNLRTGQTAGMDRTVTAWRFILLCNYLELVQSDQAAQVKNPREVARVTKLLREFGFMGDTSGRALLKVSTTTVTIPIPKVGTIYKRESQSSLNIFSLLPYLEDWAGSVLSPNRHILFLDGLDSIYLNDSKYDESLAALVQAAYTVNQQLAGNNATGSVVLLLRNDVFARVSMRVPDSQKMRDDFGIELDWRILSGAAGENAPLIQLVNSKVSRRAGIPINVLAYFPARISVGRDRYIPRLQYLLNLTRHTPRDLLRLFEEIRTVEESGRLGPAGAGILRMDVIREGVLQYASRYFVNAIRNEFAGYEGGPEAAQAGLSALQALGLQKFSKKEFAALLPPRESGGPDVDDLLRLLFYAGAIGNLVGVDSYMRFYHRRDDAEIYTGGTLILAGALCHAWNIPFAS